MTAQHSRPKLLIALLGGRIQPAALTLFQLAPDKVAPLVSADDPKVADSLTVLLADRFPQMALEPTKAVSAIDPDETRRAVERLIAAHPDHDPAVSLTGAPLPMTVAAYEVARAHGCPAYYVISTQNTLLDLVDGKALTPIQQTVALEVFLLIHNMRVASPLGQGATLPSRHRQALLLFAGDLPTATALLSCITEGENNDALRYREWRLGDVHRRMLEALAGLGILQHLRIESGSRLIFQVREGVDRDFLHGEWLEQYVYVSAQRKGTDGLAPLFDLSAYGVSVQMGAAVREIDFLGLRNGVPLIATCKSGRNWRMKSYIDEIAAIGRLLGDRSCTKLFVTNQYVPTGSSQDDCSQRSAFEQFREQAANAQVIVITGEELSHMGSIMVKEATAPTYAHK